MSSMTPQLVREIAVQSGLIHAEYCLDQADDLTAAEREACEIELSHLTLPGMWGDDTDATCYFYGPAHLA